MSNPRLLVGRAAETARIDALVAAGRGSVVFAGEAGIGKTALLDHAAAVTGLPVLRAGGSEFEAAVGFSALQQLLLPVREMWASLPLEVALGFRAGPDQDPAVVAAAAIELLDRHPALLVIDDLQWLDPASAQVIAAFAARGLLIGAARPTGAWRDLFAGIPVVELPPLDRASSAALLGTAHPGLPSEVTARLLDEAEGNPLALLELPAALTPGEPLPRHLPLTQRLQAVFGSRLRSLPADARRLLLCVALEPSIRPDLLPSFPAEQDLVHLAGGRWQFRHPLVCSAVVAGAGDEELLNAHQILGLALSAEENQIERAAWHLVQATTAPDEEVAALLERAAGVARRRGDVLFASRMLARAAEVSPNTPERLRRLNRASFLASGADPALAAELIGRARQAGSALTGQLHETLAAATVIVTGEDGDVDTAIDLLTQAIDRYAGNSDAGDALIVEALANLRWACWLAGREEPWQAYREGVLRLKPAPPPGAAVMSEVLGNPARFSAAALRGVHDLIAMLPAMTDPQTIVQVADAAQAFDLIAGCRDALARVVDGARVGGGTLFAIHGLHKVALDEFHRGDWDAARSASGRAVWLSHGGVYDSVHVWATAYQQGLLAAARGDYAAASDSAGAIARWALPRRANGVAAHGWHVESFAALGRGDFETAYQLAAAISPPGALRLSSWLTRDVALDLVEAAIRTGRGSAAEAHVEALSAAGFAQVSTRAALTLAACRALVAGDACLYERVLEPASPWRFLYARVQLLHGSHLRRTQSATAARGPLGAALETFTALGAVPWAARAQAEISATAPTRPTNGLTPQELEIAELAASGLTNKRIAERLGISHRTVGNHLYALYPKLGITSRGGLRDALTRRGVEFHQPVAGEPGA